VAGIAVVHVPYKGSPEALLDTAAGRIHYLFAPVAPSLPLIRDKRLLPLAVSTASRSPALPDVPTVAEAGLPGFDFDPWFGLFAPAKTPTAIVNQLAKEMNRILTLPDVRESMLKQGVIPQPSTPEEFEKFVRVEIKKFSKLVADAGIKKQ